MLDRVLGVIISMAAVYTALALLASWIQEQVAGIVNLRGKTLAAGILQMIGDAETRASLYGQPAIACSLPPGKPAGSDAQGTSVAPVSDGKRIPSYLSADQFSSAILGILTTGQAVAKTADETYGQILTGIATLPDCALKRALKTLATEAAGDYARFILSTEQWFNDQMDRVKGWYRRTVQILLIAIAVVVAVSCNIDSIQLVQTFATAPLPITAATSSDKNKGEANVSQQVFSEVQFGWSKPPCSSLQSCFSREFGSLFYKILGLAITAVAISFGAPFWFDVLQRFVNVRNSGPPPGKADAQS